MAKVSTYYLADEVAHTHRGMMIALPQHYWTTTYASLSPAEMAVNLSRYGKHKRGPKKPA